MKKSLSEIVINENETSNVDVSNSNSFRIETLEYLRTWTSNLQKDSDDSSEWLRLGQYLQYTSDQVRNTSLSNIGFCIVDASNNEDVDYLQQLSFHLTRVLDRLQFDEMAEELVST